MYALLAFLALVTAKAQVPTDAGIAAQIEGAIRSSLHPATVTVSVARHSPLSTVLDQVEIHISGFKVNEVPFTAPPPDPPDDPPPASADAGGPQIRVVEAHIICENFTLRSLPIAKLELFGDEVRVSKAGVDAGYLEITAAQHASGYLLINQDGLNTFLGPLPNLPIKDPAVTLSPGECRITGVTPWAVGVPVGVVGPLLVQDKAVLVIGDPQLHVISVPIPSAVGDQVLKHINPLVDVNVALKLPVPLTFTRSATADGVLRLEGTLDFPKPK